MTNKETIETIKIAISEVEWNYPMDYTIAFEEAIKALMKTDKYKWHNLRENPCDLPRVINGYGESDYLLVKTESCNMEIACYSYIKKQWSIDNYIIAWKYIEPFEEE